MKNSTPLKYVSIHWVHIPTSISGQKYSCHKNRQLQLNNCPVTEINQQGLSMPLTRDPDYQMLQGSWEQIALEDNGVQNPVDDAHSAPGALTTIHGDQFEVQTVDGKVLLAGRFFLDSGTQPKSITWIDTIGEDAGKQLPASYRLEKDEFVFIAADEGMPRPIAFSTGPGQTMRTFVRRT
jgi:uncharacterized protein (TIGR03067 family)